MSQELFADRIGDITVANGMVRIEFAHSNARRRDPGNRILCVSSSSYPLASFKEIVGRQTRLLDKLVEQSEKKTKEPLQ